MRWQLRRANREPRSGIALADDLRSGHRKGVRRHSLPASARHWDLLHPVLEVGHELVYCLVGLGVLGHLPEELRGHRDDVGASLEGLVDVHNVANAADDDFRGMAPLPERRPYLSDDRPCVVTDVSDAAV